jgi:hypothetical protein
MKHFRERKYLSSKNSTDGYRETNNEIVVEIAHAFQNKLGQTEAVKWL